MTLSRLTSILIVVVIGLMSLGAESNSGKKAIGADEVYAGAVQIWSRGDESGAAKVVDQARKSFPSDMRFVFFAATDAFAHRQVDDADALFTTVAGAIPNEPYGRAATCVLNLDTATEVDANLKLLDDLTSGHPDDPILLWVVAAQYGAFQRDNPGAQRYAKLLTLVDPGPGIVQESYADILDHMNRPADALPHRLLAVKLSPSGSSFTGLGNTMTRLKRWREADAAYQQATKLEPNRAANWRAWADSKTARGNFLAAPSLMDRADQAASAKISALAPPQPLSDEEALGPADQSLTADQFYSAALQAWIEGKVNVTLEFLDHGLDVFPDDARIAYLAGVCLLGENHKDQAYMLFDRIRLARPNSTLGRAATQVQASTRPYPITLNDPPHQLSDIAHQNPNDPVLTYSAIQIAANGGNIDLPSALFDQLMPQLNPGVPEVHDAYGDFLLRIREPQKALAERQLAVKLKPTSERYRLLGVTYTILKQWPQADDAFRKAINLDPSNHKVSESWAWSREMKGNAQGNN